MIYPHEKSRKSTDPGNTFHRDTLCGFIFSEINISYLSQVRFEQITTITLS
ncbi:hypothetical protein JCM10003_3268 [Bacteroides pyogenes JCM 10003]|uniref:Uncharacterized protein n=2 Tax=Bacteroides pyogenes TaxID=310300 RepID=W4PFJ6_9BACE|nr:hypothetical protein JCM6292_1998 [Bacteroides pyogenes JCM 6292]GAE18552.1 hypothetical protein JCM6294_1461 [Bacteroides pyogenes DSM 20611 = JCM 6294]GAE23493.1 hypothetical protein JCM10003_3268 [Bacteroides pyogenes JCM 10003]